jgi:hypothetical protein
LTFGKTIHGRNCSFCFTKMFLIYKVLPFILIWTQQIKVITKLPNSEQSYKGKVKTHNYINRQNQSTIDTHIFISSAISTHQINCGYLYIVSTEKCAHRINWNINLHILSASTDIYIHIYRINFDLINCLTQLLH